MQAWAERKEPACNMMLHKVLNQMATKEVFFLFYFIHGHTTERRPFTMKYKTRRYS